MPPNKKIPDRWTDYSAVGKRIPGTRFIAFKVPLKQSLRNWISQSEAFGPFDLLHVLEKEGLELGLVIDLTFTTRYYKPQDLPDSLLYLKIFTAGHEVPSDATILSFKKAVRRFLRDNENNDKLIGVHCTHGLNRTGYLVCRYLIDVDGIEPGEAIKLFNASRGHSIERQNYLDDLTSGPKRSNEGMEEPDQEPIQGGARQGSSSGPDRPNPPHTYQTFSRRGPHQLDQITPFQPKTANHQLMFGPPGPPGPPGPGLLPLPRGVLPHPQGPWPRRPLDHSFRQGRYSTSPPYPPFLPRYSLGGPWGGETPGFSPGGPEGPQESRRTSRYRHGKSRRGRAR
ncbi:RNA/RNP complex-1-interacting phosphatase [Salminus brasiliensis]|uniref:RNA/RNP complex-1-interacting phosphatase n=1 Tax=Salminus brasiliensis TaxID=930266 RepID=UPI003B82E1BB